MNQINKTNKKLFHRLFVNSFIFNPFFSKKTDVIIFDSGRLYKYENKYVDIYMDYLCEYYDEKKNKYIKIETNYLNDKPFLKRNFKNKHIDFINLASKTLSFFQNNTLLSEEIKFLEFIEKEIHRLFKININLLEIINSDIREFKSKDFLYFLLFKKVQPKDIFLINAGLKTYIVSAAKKLNIRVNELQHGLISNRGIINNFPNSPHNSLAYYPDRFFKWNNVDMCHAVIPLSKNNIVSIPNEHLNRVLKSTYNIEKEKNVILVISQPYSSLDIIRYIERNLKYLKNYKILYKSHPVENKSVIKKFEHRIYKKYDNISIINDSKQSVYPLLKKAEYVIGVYSSVLFEAHLFECEVILLNLDGVEMSYPLLNKPNVKLIEVNDKLNEVLR